MSNARTPIAARGSKSGARRSVTLDPLTAASHPDAAINAALLGVIGVLVITGLIGLLEPVASLDLFRPDAPLAAQVRSLGEIGVSFLALVTAGLGLARHPRFPTALLGVAAGLCLLIAFELAQGLLNPLAPDAFPILGVLVVLTVPYVRFSRRCRLIFHRRLDLSDMRPPAEAEDWTVPHSMPVMAPALAPPVSAPTVPAPKRARARRPGFGAAAPRAQGLTAPAKPPADPSAAALWAALYGPSDAQGEMPPTEPSSSETANAGSSGGRRVGLEALINLRPPGY